MTPLLTYTENAGPRTVLRALRWMDHLPGFLLCEVVGDGAPARRCFHRSDLRLDGRPLDVFFQPAATGSVNDEILPEGGA